MQESGLTETIPFSYPGQYPVFFTSWAPLGLTLGNDCSLIAANSHVFFYFWVPLGLTRSHWRAAITEDCDILLYWYGKKYSISQYHPEALTGLSVQFSSVQSLSCVWLFATPLIAARQASLSITNTQSSLRLTSIKSVMPSSHLILCRPLLLLPPVPPSIRVFSNESTLCMRWSKHWSFSLASVLPKNTQGWSP